MHALNLQPLPSFPHCAADIPFALSVLFFSALGWDEYPIFGDKKSRNYATLQALLRINLLYSNGFILN